MDKTLTKPDVWSIRKLQENVDKGIVRIPEFQRSVVWDTEKKERLIDSLLSGFPVGALLLYGSRGEAAYLLVDGLQRTTAIRDYLKEPLTLAPDDILDTVLCDRLGDVISGVAGCTVDKGQLTKQVFSWLRKTRTLDHNTTYTWMRLVQHLAEALGVDPTALVFSSDVEDAAQRILQSVEEACDIKDIELPIMIYSGQQGSLPQVFELLNTQGTELGKYDVFAATWVGQSTSIRDSSIREAIKEKYRFLIEEKGYEIEGIGPNLEIRSFSLFEYLFGLGKVLSEQFPLLFESKNSVADPDSTGFTLATIAYRTRLGDMRSLPQRIHEMSPVAGDMIEPSPFQDALFDACSFVEDVLRPYIGIKLNQRGGKSLLVHSDYQIASIVCTALVHKYHAGTWTAREEWTNDEQQLRRCIPQRYLYDMVSDPWRGPVDSRLFNLTWQRVDESDTFRPSPAYLREISRNDWESALDGWAAQQLQKENTGRGRVDSAQKVFLAYVYSNRISHQQLHLHDFDIDHLVPVKRIAAKIKADPAGRGWPISAIGNLALLTETINREKGGRTVQEYTDAGANTDERRVRSQGISRLLFVDPGEVVIGDVGDSEIERQEYIQFALKNFEAMKKELLDNVLRIPRVD